MKSAERKFAEQSRSASRRSFVKGLGAAGWALPALAHAAAVGFSQRMFAAIYANAAIDWKQFAGQTITLAGAIHPWSNAIHSAFVGFHQAHRYQRRY